MYKRIRVNSDSEMEESQESTATTSCRPSTSNILLENTPDNTNSTHSTRWESDEEGEHTTTPETFKTAKLNLDQQETITPSIEALFRTLRRLKGKTIQCQHHIDNMELHIMKGTCPKGLQITVQPNVPTVDPTLLREWERLNLNHQTKLIICIRDYWRRHHQNLLEQCNSLQDELKSSVSQTEWTKMLDQIDKTMKATQDNYNKPRRRSTNQGGSSKGKSGRN
jgi:hypothetical protein